MQNITQVVELLEDKLLLILERYDFLKEENKLIREDMVQLQHQLNLKEQLLEEKESNFDSLKVARTIQGSDDTKKTTKKINTLIKEIDLCIAQLSD
ncbi:MAG TPA: hypothetical protein EYG92_01135 [Lutibacter sp.]|nr:hypothetical protein [Lutibacter sp.]